MVMDATEAGKKVRKHFEEVHGPYSVMGFQVESAKMKGIRWEIVCKFSPLSSSKPLRYRVIVGPRGVLDVEQLEIAAK